MNSLRVLLVVAVVAAASAVLPSSPALAADTPTSVSIGNGPTNDDYTYLNAADLAANMAVTSIVVQATSDVTVVDPSDLSTSSFGLPVFNLTLAAPVCNIDGDLNLSAYGHLFLTCDTVNLTARITSGGSTIAASRVTSTATQVNVVSTGASIQQAMDVSSGTSPAVIAVSAGQYAENLMISHPLTLSGDDGDVSAGAGLNAPLVVGTQAGGAVISVTADDVTVDGLHLNGLVDGGTVQPSVTGVLATGVDNLTVRQNTLDGFTGTAVDTVGSTNVLSEANDTTPTLLSTAITPADPTITAGTDQQLEDLGTYSEGPTSEVTTQATWSSTDPAVATVDEAGLVHGLTSGTTTVSAVVGALTATTVVTVNPAVPATHTVTFDANGGVGAMSSQSASAPTALTANTLSRDGFAFAGWNTSPDGSGTAYADTATYPFTDDTTLYAQWTANAQLAQSITFAAITRKTLAQSPLLVSATSSSGLPVSFSTTTPLVCTAGGPSGATITLLRTGTCRVRASQPGNATYLAAPAVTRSFTVG